jgi:acyl carrier protein
MWIGGMRADCAQPCIVLQFTSGAMELEAGARMERQEVFERARQLMAHIFDVPPDAIVETTRADDIEGWDSLSHLILLTGIEKRFDVTLPTLEAHAAQNVGALVDLVWHSVSRKDGHG